MPGTFTFKPIKAELKEENDVVGKLEPYYTVITGDQQITGKICKEGGKNPYWEDSVNFEAKPDSFCFLELKDKDDILPDGILGSCEINLSEAEAQGKIAKWYDLSHNQQTVGKILIETSYMNSQ